MTLQAAFREDYSNDHVAKELERLATAADKWNELIGDYTTVVQGIADPKQAADLWVKIARWYDSALRHTDYAIASAQQALQLDNAHLGALQALEDFYRKQKKWTDLVAVLARHAECELDPTLRVDILLQLADTYETQVGDAAQAMNAYQRALDTDERCIDAINALERLYRRTQAWDRLVEVLAKKAQVVDDTDQAIKLKLQVGELWEDRLGDNDRAVEAYKEVLSVDPRNLAGAHGARRALREDRSDGGVPREPRAPAGGLAARRGPGRHLPEDGDDLGGEFRQARSRRRGAREDPPHRRQERKGLPQSRAALPPGAQVGVAGRDLPQAPRRHRRRQRANRSLHQDGRRSTSGSCAISIAPSTRTTTCSTVEARPPRGAGGHRAPLRGDRAVGSGGRGHAAPHPRQRRPEGESRPQLPTRQDVRRADEGSGAGPGVPGRGALAGSRPRPVDAVAARHLQAARRLAEGGAAHGPRRGRHRQPAGEDPPAARGRQDLPGQAG